MQFADAGEHSPSQPAGRAGAGEHHARGNAARDEDQPAPVDALGRYLPVVEDAQAGDEEEHEAEQGHETFRSLEADVGFEIGAAEPQGNHGEEHDESTDFLGVQAAEGVEFGADAFEGRGDFTEFRREQLHEAEPAEGDHDHGAGDAHRHPLGKGNIHMSHVADVLHGEHVGAAAGGRGRAADKGAPDDADHEGASEIALEGLAAAAFQDAYAQREEHGGNGHVRDPHGGHGPDGYEGQHDAVGAAPHLGEHPQHEASGEARRRHGRGKAHGTHEEQQYVVAEAQCNELVEARHAQDMQEHDQAKGRSGKGDGFGHPLDDREAKDGHNDLGIRCKRNGFLALIEG